MSELTLQADDLEQSKLPSSNNHRLAATVGHLRPINRLPKHAIDCIAKRATVYHAAVGESLQSRLCDEKIVEFLIDGSVQIFQQDGSSETIIATDARAKNALGRYAKHAKDIVACCPSELVRIPWEALERYLIQYAPAELSSTLEVQEILSSTSSDWMVRLLQSDLFSCLPATNIQNILNSIEFIDTFADEVVVQEGAIGDHFFIVDHGEFLVSRQNSKTGAEMQLAVLKGGDFFGEEALITAAPRGATVTSTGTGKLIRLDSEKFKEYVVAPAVPLLSADGAKSLIVNGARLIDIREPDKYAVSAIPDSANIMLNLLRAENSKLDKQRTYIIVDDTPIAATTAAFVLRAKGYDAHCLNLPLEKYAVLQGIELGQAGETQQVPASISSPDQPLLERISEYQTGQVFETSENKDNELGTLGEIDRLNDDYNTISDSGAGGQPEGEADTEEYARTLTGIGLADLIEELNETYDDDVDTDAEIPVQIVDLAEQDLNTILSDDPTVANDLGENSPSASGYSIEYYDDSENQSCLAAPPNDEDVLSPVGLHTETTSAEVASLLQAEKRAARMAIRAHRIQVAKEYREKQTTLLNHGKKLIALAHKISQQKAEIERARQEMALAPTVTKVGGSPSSMNSRPTATTHHIVDRPLAAPDGWSSFLRVAKR